MTGILKQALTPDIHGISIVGGKGSKATSTIRDIPKLAENLGLSNDKIDSLLHASKMSAKIDGTAFQDGYSLYHHVILFDEHGDWAVVPQGMNSYNRSARRYHWASNRLMQFTYEPHGGIVGSTRVERVLDMTSRQSQDNQKVSLDIACDYPESLKSSISRLYAKGTLDGWLGVEPFNLSGYEMPRRLDWDLFRRIYDLQPRSYDEILSMCGVGSVTVRALALVAELIHGTPASWEDPVKYSFAHGGKDGVPHPVARKVYDESISYLQDAIEGAELDREERNEALRKLAQLSETMFGC